MIPVSYFYNIMTFRINYVSEIYLIAKYWIVFAYNIFLWKYLFRLCFNETIFFLPDPCSPLSSQDEDRDEDQMPRTSPAPANRGLFPEIRRLNINCLSYS